MAILDRILGKKERKDESLGPKKPKGVGAQKKAGKEPARKKETAKKGVRAKKNLKKEENIAHRTLIEPFVTEKSTNLGQFNKYVFKVDANAGKNQVREAIQDYYGVGVISVNIIKIRPKKRVHGRTIGYKRGFKKAVVTLRKGDAIGAAEGV